MTNKSKIENIFLTAKSKQNDKFETILTKVENLIVNDIETNADNIVGYTMDLMYVVSDKLLEEINKLDLVTMCIIDRDYFFKKLENNLGVKIKYRISTSFDYIWLVFEEQFKEL
jgi:hypothetical protein